MKRSIGRGPDQFNATSWSNITALGTLHAWPVFSFRPGEVYFRCPGVRKSERRGE